MILQKILELVLQNGARLAEPGEFTKQAFLNGRIDLTQAEAVIDVIEAKTEAGLKIASRQLHGSLSDKLHALHTALIDCTMHIEAAIDFPEDEIETVSKRELSASMEDIHGKLLMLVKTYDEARFFREGLSTAIVGRPNVGKSSLLNALLQKDRAIVTETPGTTRDTIEEYLNIRGLPLRIMDTAGIREVKDLAEKEGVKRTLQSIVNSDLVIAQFDRSAPLQKEDFEVLRKNKDKTTIFVLNKSDLPAAFDQTPSLPSRAATVLSSSRSIGEAEVLVTVRVVSTLRFRVPKPSRAATS